MRLCNADSKKQFYPVLKSDHRSFVDPTAITKLDAIALLIELCQTRIPRDLLAYNARLARYEMLKAIRQQSKSKRITDYERQANPDTPLDL